MATYTLLKRIDGKTARFYLDTTKAIKGELAKLQKDGWIKEPAELRGAPSDAVTWNGTVPELDEEERDRLLEVQDSDRRKYSLLKKHSVAAQLEQIWKALKAINSSGVDFPPEVLTMMNEITGD